MEFVSFEIAKKLKEKGYPQLTFGQYDMQSACYVEDGRFYENGCITEVSRAYTAPRISEVLKWFREEKKIYISISYMPKVPNETGVLNDFYYPSFQKIGLFEPMFFIGGDVRYDNYEEAALAGIEYCLNNLI